LVTEAVLCDDTPCKEDFTSSFCKIPDSIIIVSRYRNSTYFHYQDQILKKHRMFLKRHYFRKANIFPGPRRLSVFALFLLDRPKTTVVVVVACSYLTTSCSIVGLNTVDFINSKTNRWFSLLLLQLPFHFLHLTIVHYSHHVQQIRGQDHLSECCQ